MAQDSIPQFTTDQDKGPNIIVGDSQTKVADQGYTYNQAGLTYNQAGVQYGGVYLVDQNILPLVASVSPILFSNQASATNAKLLDQGYTYNQPGFSYNQAGVDYGGVYLTNQDIAPSFLNDSATIITPRISGIIDIGIIGTGGGTITPPTNSGMLIGILGLTYP